MANESMFGMGKCMAGRGVPSEPGDGWDEQADMLDGDTGADSSKGDNADDDTFTVSPLI